MNTMTPMLLKPIYYKEFLKIRWLWLTLVALNGLLMAYLFVETRRLFVLDHAEIVWYRVMHLNQIHYSLLKYAPVITGLLLAAIQYLPEMVGERLRLSLHLPVSPHRLVMAHVLVGLTALGVVIALDLSALALITARFFPAEAVAVALWTALPWCLAGVAAYLGVTLALLEPGYRLKLFNLAIAAGVAGLFLRPAEPGGYYFQLANLALPLLLLIPAVLLPAYRFRYRRVS
jgi:hypothetical protein